MRSWVRAQLHLHVPRRQASPWLCRLSSGQRGERAWENRQAVHADKVSDMCSQGRCPSAGCPGWHPGGRRAGWPDSWGTCCKAALQRSGTSGLEAWQGLACLGTPVLLSPAFLGPAPEIPGQHHFFSTLAALPVHTASPLCLCLPGPGPVPHPDAACTTPAGRAGLPLPRLWADVDVGLTWLRLGPASANSSSPPQDMCSLPELLSRLPGLRDELTTFLIVFAEVSMKPD